MKVKLLLILFTFFLSLALYNQLAPATEAASYEIASALSSTNVSGYIVSIDVLTIDELRRVCDRSDALACTISEFNDSTDKLEYSKIYISDFKDYTGCKAFRHTLYHEIGHVEYSYYFGAGGNDSEREGYANEYAGRFAKNECN